MNHTYCPALRRALRIVMVPMSFAPASLMVVMAWVTIYRGKEEQQCLSLKLDNHDCAYHYDRSPQQHLLAKL